MTIEPMDLGTLTDEDLAEMLAAFRALASELKSRVALDLFTVIELEMLRRHQPTEIADYTDSELSNLVGALMSAVDKGRETGIRDDYPAMQFLLLNLTALINELQRRGMAQELQ